MTTMRELTQEVKRLREQVEGLQRLVNELAARPVAPSTPPWWNPTVPGVTPVGPIAPWWERQPRTGDPMPWENPITCSDGHGVGVAA